ncbi:MAG TPA: helix-turn-helix domain-containing protein [Candidatus Acidoferrales bacterium]|jgi:AcrR family transcriptional regulator|nr:helix-turn-helix domain-containing protein [Candidatus Acidoferrales bacterium]
MAKKTLAPQQARSRESTRKLLKAAGEVLGQHGLEGATIPRIAQHAGLTPGAIYRRFPDKDALLETVILRILERSDERLRMMLTPAMARQIPLAVFAEQLINNMLVSYRANAGLLRALRQFAQGRDHTSFYKKVTRLEMRTYQYLVGLFLVHRKEIKHPEPQMAVSFAIAMLVSTLIELILVDHDMKNWQAVLPKDDLSLKRELLRSFLRYLGIEQKGG